MKGCDKYLEYQTFPFILKKPILSKVLLKVIITFQKTKVRHFFYIHQEITLHSVKDIFDRINYHIYFQDKLLKVKKKVSIISFVKLKLSIHIYIYIKFHCQPVVFSKTPISKNLYDYYFRQCKLRNNKNILICLFVYLSRICSETVA